MTNGGALHISGEVRFLCDACGGIMWEFGHLTFLIVAMPVSFYLFEFLGVSGCFSLKSTLSGVRVSVSTETRV